MCLMWPRINVLIISLAFIDRFRILYRLLSVAKILKIISITPHPISNPYVYAAIGVIYFETLTLLYF